ncbi:hypothetical protein QR680_012243 [Steinernema hermaphroditum]|uniref:Uncharacterized protein n=1 Tax=Steinernema hermaphroditum TaxID=289476 RepID=A0AA39I440_9BILA|nr:hypothetical protein QR680_012243 [Steinernema hermaphroditum]
MGYNIPLVQIDNEHIFSASDTLSAKRTPKTEEQTIPASSDPPADDGASGSPDSDGRIKRLNNLQDRLSKATNEWKKMDNFRERGFAEARTSVNKEVRGPDGRSIIKCFVCQGKHYTNSCYEYASYGQRIDRCFQLGLCGYCVTKKHRGNCRSELFCRACEGAHSTAMCTRYQELKIEIKKLEGHVEYEERRCTKKNVRR